MKKLDPYIIGGIIVLLAIIGSVIYYFFGNNIQKTTVSVGSPQTPNEKTEFKALIPRNQNVSTQITDDVEKWLVYSGEGLSFKYPPEWKTEAVRPTHVVLYSPDLLEPPKGTPISVYINPKSMNTVIDAINKTLTNVQTTDIKNDNYSGKELRGQLNIPSLGDVNMFISIFDNNNQSLIVEYTVYPGATDYQKAYQDIVQSVKG